MAIEFAKAIRAEIAKLEKGTTHSSPPYILTKANAAAPKKPGRPPSGKVRLTLLVDPAVIAKFKATGDGWQARMNDVLAKAEV